MPKPFGEGLKFFQVDIDFHEDDKIDVLREEFGDAGVAFWVLLHARIYKNSYYLKLDQETVNLFCKKWLLKPVVEFEQILDFAIKIKIFDKHCYKQYNVLTSCAIQQRYLAMVRRWLRIKMISEYMIEDVNTNENHLFIYNIKGKYLGHKPINGDLIAEDYKPQGRPLKIQPEQEEKPVTEPPKQPLPISTQFDDLPELITPDHFRDMELEEMSAGFFKYNEKTGFDNVKLFTYFLTALNFRDELDQFRLQFPAYIKYKQLSGEKIPHFKNFIGDQKERFTNGLWKNENWVSRLDQELSKSHNKNGHAKTVESKAEQAIASHENFMKNFPQ